MLFWNFISPFPKSLFITANGTAGQAVRELLGGVYDWCHDQNITPGKDIPVTGFDNRELSAYLYPPLTTVNLPLKQIGRKSCEVADHMIADGENHRLEKQYLKIKCKVVNRTSL